MSNTLAEIAERKLHDALDAIGSMQADAHKLRNLDLISSEEEFMLIKTIDSLDKFDLPGIAQMFQVLTMILTVSFED